MKQAHHIDIRATPEQVFHWLDDAQRVMAWAEGVVENEDLDLRDGKVGSTFRQVYAENGRRMEFRGVVTAFEQDRRLGVALEGDSFDLDVDYVLEPLGSGTRLTQRSAANFKGLWRVMGVLAGPWIRKSGEKQLRADFQRLKALCESESAEGVRSGYGP